ncbi:hypothetical protein O988_08931 [Pseudogymnoascus sp. VKM F-3808]|nr:hypothetical protein O988_08931 [Pseudogymnoascus sp. VKM F-3808]
MAAYSALISIVEKSLKLEECIFLHMAMLASCIARQSFSFPVTKSWEEPKSYDCSSPCRSLVQNLLWGDIPVKTGIEEIQINTIEASAIDCLNSFPYIC